MVLENWGVLWMCHSAMILLHVRPDDVASVAAGLSQPHLVSAAVGRRADGVGRGLLAAAEARRAGAVRGTAGRPRLGRRPSLATIGVFVVEMLLGLPVLTLSPMLAVIAGMTFVVKAGMLSGSFYSRRRRCS